MNSPKLYNKAVIKARKPCKRDDDLHCWKEIPGEKFEKSWIPPTDIVKTKGALFQYGSLPRIGQYFLVLFRFRNDCL